MEFLPQTRRPAEGIIESVTCADGTRLRYRVWPATHSREGTFVIVPGMMSHSQWFGEIATVLSERRLHVVGAERRDSGLNIGGPEPNSRARVLDDLRIILDREVRGPLWLAGWCWGALPATCMALSLGTQLSGIALLAPGLFPSDLIKRSVQRLLDSSVALNPMECVLPSPISEYMFSDRKEVQDFILRDPFAKRNFSANFLRISHELSVIAVARLHTLQIPVLIALASQDVTVDSDATLRAARRLQTPVTVTEFSCYHAMHMEMPDAVADELLRWTQMSVLRKSA